MMVMMMMVKMTIQFFNYLLTQHPSGRVKRQHKYKDRSKTIEENINDRRKNKIKKHNPPPPPAPPPPHHHHQRAIIPGARSL
jgi:hypothetical protein